MHVRKILIVAVVLLSAVSICYGQEADTGNPAINFDLAVDYFGKYILRGQNLVDDPVLQSNISVSYGKLTASQSDEMIIDWSELVRRLGDDEEFIKDVVEAWIIDNPARVTALADAIKGSSATVGAKQLLRVARKLQTGWK